MVCVTAAWRTCCSATHLMLLLPVPPFLCACRGFRVAETCPPAAGLTCTCAPRLPGGCTDVVTVLPGPRDLHAPDLLAEARRLMAAGGYLAVAWNDRCVLFLLVLL